jgi:two-component system, NarL family, nitrate/nitrite response regulator NarL
MRVLIVDDHSLFADALSTHLEDEGIAVIGVAGSGEEARKIARETEPDLVLMDLRLPDESGIDAGRQIMHECPETKVLAVTGLTNAATIDQVIGAGFHGFLTKNTQLSKLVTAMEAAHGGNIVFSRTASAAAVGAQTEDERDASLRASFLTWREREVLSLLAMGADSARIARELSISRNTVRSHVQSILTKLQVHSRLAAATFAVRYGIVQPPQQAVGV